MRGQTDLGGVTGLSPRRLTALTGALLALALSASRASAADVSGHAVRVLDSKSRVVAPQVVRLISPSGVHHASDYVPPYPER
jgi:hypothetical protein